jgi:hypothetical protein
MKPINFVAALLICIASGCSSIKITHSWESPMAQQKEYSKIIVVALLKDNDRNFRERMEDHMVGDLTDLGYSAVSSLREFGPQYFEGIKEEEAIAKLQSSGANAVISIVLLDKEKERKYVPASVVRSPYIVYHRRFWGYYSTMSTRIYEPGYYTEQTNYFWESNFFDLATKELQYSVQTRSFDSNSAESLGHEYGRLIVKDMVKHNLLIKKK